MSFKLTKETRDQLMKLKYEYGFSSVEALFQALIKLEKHKGGNNGKLIT
jgi:hypothetical protein